ncbi:hypothetical protein SHELI_v1c10100 [Spiroplasma helicoides]|uniref:Spiralin-like protein n=1 Tax=Spiroplasma helicoides TaxID=216938 RepID=A0A1B3SM19_9MOLU|nr:lipoprotein [Spiroplasma helicoides]AOG60957.1 hypothetical protein SHELI_v1c10100 [Spiroplasma helicoides]
MKKLLSLLAATGLVATSGSVAVACNKKADDKATTSTKKDLTKIGEANLKLAPNANDEAAAKSAVIDQIKAKLSVTVVEKTDITFSDFVKAESSSKAGSIKVTAVESSTLITGSATFSLTFKEAQASTKTQLNKVVKVAQLDKIDFSAEKPTAEDLLKGIKAKNSDLPSDFSINDFTIENSPEQTTTTATIKGAGDKYEGTVALTYSKKEAVNAPVLAFGGENVQENAIEIKQSVGNGKATIIIKVTNKIETEKAKAISATSGNVQVEQNSEGVNLDTYNFILTGLKNSEETSVTFSYKNAKDLVLKVKTSGFSG